MGVNNIAGLRDCLDFAQHNQYGFTDTLVDNELLEALLGSYDLATKIMQNFSPAPVGVETIPGPDGEANWSRPAQLTPSWVIEAQIEQELAAEDDDFLKTDNDNHTAWNSMVRIVTDECEKSRQLREASYAENAWGPF